MPLRASVCVCIHLQALLDFLKGQGQQQQEPGRFPKVVGQGEATFGKLNSPIRGSLACLGLAFLKGQLEQWRQQEKAGGKFVFVFSTLREMQTPSSLPLLLLQIAGQWDPNMVCIPWERIPNGISDLLVTLGSSSLLQNRCADKPIILLYYS